MDNTVTCEQYNMNHYNAFKNAPLGPNLGKVGFACYDIKELIKKYDELDISNLSSYQERFDLFNQRVREKFKKIDPFTKKEKARFSAIEIAHIALCCLHLEKSCFSSIKKMVDLLSWRQKELLEESKPFQGFVFSDLLQHRSVFSYDELGSLSVDESLFFLQYLCVVEGNVIGVKTSLEHVLAVEKLKSYWSHSNPRIALEAKKIYLYICSAAFNVQFYKQSRYHNVVSTSYCRLYCESQEGTKCIPLFASLALDTIIPVATRAFIDYQKMVNPLGVQEYGDESRFLLSSNDIKQVVLPGFSKILNSYLEIENHQREMYKTIYAFLLEEKKRALKKKLLTLEELRTLTRLECWANPDVNRSDQHPPLSDSLGESLVQQKREIGIFSHEKPKEQQWVDVKTDNTENVKSSRVLKKKKSKKKKKHSVLSTLETHEKPKKKEEPKFSIALSESEKEVQNLLNKSPFKKALRVRRWEKLIDLIPEKGFPEYAHITFSKALQEEHIKRHRFISIVDRLRYDKRYAIETKTGFALLAHVEFNEKQKEYSVITYGLDEKNRIYHRYIESSCSIFYKNVLEKVREIEVPQYMEEKEEEESTTSYFTTDFTLDFDPASSVFTIKDSVLHMVITIFPVPVGNV